MASKSAALLLSLNLLLFAVLTSATTLPANCPPDALKLTVCADVLNALKLGLPVPQTDCCPLITNLIALDATACLCISLQINVLDLLTIPVSNIDLTLLLNYCKAPNANLCAS